MMPALKITASSGRPRLAISEAACRTEAGSDSSQATAVVSAPKRASTPLVASAERPVPITWAPRMANTRADSLPRPEVTPVIRMLLPVRSSPAVTCSAVEA